MTYVPLGAWNAFIEDEAECLRQEEELKANLEDPTGELVALHGDFKRRRLEVRQRLEEVHIRRLRILTYTEHDRTARIVIP